MSRLDRAQLIDLAENRYFANVDEKNLAAVLDCFHPDAVVTVQSHFTEHAGRDDGIRKMFESLFEYDLVLHTDFETIADAEGQAVSSRFRVELEKDGAHTTLMNVNHWYVVDGRFQRVYIWMSGDNVLV